LRRPEIPDDALVIFSDLDEVPSAKARISAKKGTGKFTEKRKVMSFIGFMAAMAATYKHY
jgi:hypothetical protein